MDATTSNDDGPLGPASVGEWRARLTGMVGNYRPLVCRNLKRLGVDDARVDDAAQEVFLIVARKVRDIRPGCERSYVLGVSVGVAANCRRARVRRDLDPDEGLHFADPAPSADALLDRKRERELLGRALNSLAPKLQRVLVSHELEGLSVVQIAKHGGTPVGTVASQLRRARDCFRRALRRELCRSTRARSTPPDRPT